MRKIRLGLLVLLAVLLLFAWYDGGREPQRMIEQPVELPADVARDLAGGGGAGR